MSSDLLSLAPGGFPADSRHIFSGRVPFFCSILGIATPVPSVIMYADEITDSMDRAITETERRRAIQMAYNKEHGIVPKTIVKAIPDSIEISDKAENAKMNTRRMGKLEREAAIDRLTREMKEAAKLLEFEHAAFLRDQIDRLRRGENPTADSSAEQERKQNHAQTQRRGRKYLGKR